ncbi:transposase [Mesorhizobium sp. M0244]|uniref:transposase n=1 Tax=Mesorhizobium sp. M0244 TaxID=2956926 RepID=UPI003335D6B7
MVSRHGVLSRHTPAFSSAGRYTHRVAVSNHGLIHIEDSAVRLRWKDYRPSNREMVTGGRVHPSHDEFQVK